MVTWPSFMASSSADCVLGVVRLISSASRKLVKIGPGLNSKASDVDVIDGDAENVAGQHVAGELQAVEAARHGAGQGLRQGGLADAGHVLDEQMAARQQADEGQPDDFGLAANGRPEGGLQFGQLGEDFGRESSRRGHD